VKLGDWIAIFNEGAQLVQYDTPERILAEPANEFVENFIGSGAGLKQLTLTRVDEVEVADAVVARPGDLATDVLSRMDAVGHNHSVIVDARNRPLQWLSRRQLSRLERVGAARDPRLPVVGNRATLNDALDTMLVSSVGAALVTGPPRHVPRRNRRRHRHGRDRAGTPARPKRPRPGTPGRSEHRHAPGRAGQRHPRRARGRPGRTGAHR
jgi:ABC-type proline/glycine betaine transport system ATPase subunit